MLIGHSRCEPRQKNLHLSLLRKVGFAHNTELSSLNRGRVLRLRARQRDCVFAWDDDAISLRIHLAQRARINRQTNVSCLARTKMHAFKSCQHSQRSFVCLRLRKVQLNHLIASRCARVLHVAFYGDWIASLDAGGDFQVAVLEARVTESEAESIERLLCEV